MGRDRTLIPTGWVHRGEAYLMEGRKRILVWGGIPGEPGRVRIYHEGTNQDLGRFVRPADSPDAQRQKPPCIKYTLCGGCPLMHLTEAGQHTAKLTVLNAALEQFDLQSHTPVSITASPDGVADYRHVVKLAAGRSDEGHVRLGALGRDSHTVVPISRCLVAVPALRKATGLIAKLVIDMDIWPYDSQTGQGSLRYVVLRQSRTSTQILVTLVAAKKSNRLGELAQEIINSVPDVGGVHMHYNDNRGNAIFKHGEDGQVHALRLHGNHTIEERLSDIRLRIGPGDFFQINPSVAELLINDVVSAMASHRHRPVVDLYCGVGGFAIALAKHHQWAIGVEGVGGAIVRAKANAQLNHASAEFVCGDVLEVLPQVKQRLGGAAPVVVVDPARRGLHPSVIEGLLNLNPAAIAYVSCNPATLARDLADFIDRGWSVQQMTAYDMFPQTAHLETLTILAPNEPVSADLARGPRRRIVR